MKRMFKLLLVLMAFSLTNLSYAQIGSGNGKPDEIQGIIEGYQKKLPSCVLVQGSGPFDPHFWLDQVGSLIADAKTEASLGFFNNGVTAYKHLFGAVSAIELSARNCVDLKSVATWPVAKSILMQTQILINEYPQSVTSGGIVYNFLLSALDVIEFARREVDATFRLPFGRYYSPGTGFDCDRLRTECGPGCTNTPVFDVERFSLLNLWLARRLIELSDQVLIISGRGVTPKGDSLTAYPRLVAQAVSDAEALIRESVYRYTYYDLIEKLENLSKKIELLMNTTGVSRAFVFTYIYQDLMSFRSKLPRE